MPVVQHNIIDCRLATKVFLGKLPATRGVWIIVGRPMMRGDHGPTRKLQDLNWGAFDHVSHVRTCNYNIIIIATC